MVVDGVQKHNGVNGLQRPLLPPFDDGQGFIRDAANGGVRKLYAVDIPDMGLNLPGGHAFGITLRGVSHRHHG